MTTVTGNNGTVSCQQWCYMSGYNKCTGTSKDGNCQAVYGLVDGLTCTCENSGTVTSVSKNNGSVSCNQYCNMAGYSSAISGYDGAIPVTAATVYGKDLTCFCNNPADTVTSVSGNNGSVSCNQYCNMAGYATAYSGYDGAIPVDTATVYGKALTCFCNNPTDLVTVVTGNNGTVSCNQYCNMAGYASAYAGYDGSAVDIDTIHGSDVTCVCNNPPNAVSSVTGNDANTPCQRICTSNGYTSCNSAYSGGYNIHCLVTNPLSNASTCYCTNS